MSFSGKPTNVIQQAIPNDGFWPELQVAEFQRLYRLPAEFLLDLLVDGVTTARAEVNQDLAKRKRAWQAAGIPQLETADPRVLPDRAEYVAHYKRAVYCRAKAQLLGQFATVSRRPEAENLAKEAEQTRELFLSYSQQAVRLIQGRSRITAELL